MTCFVLRNFYYIQALNLHAYYVINKVKILKFSTQVNISTTINSKKKKIDVKKEVEVSFKLYTVVVAMSIRQHYLLIIRL